MGPHVDWIVIGKLGAQFLGNWDEWPKAIRIFKFQNMAGVTAYRMQAIPATAGDRHMTSLEGIEAHAPTDLVAQLEAEFFFICEDTTRWAYGTPHQVQTAV